MSSFVWWGHIVPEILCLIEIIRGRKRKQLSVNLGERPSQQALSAGRFLQESGDTWGVQTALTQSFDGEKSNQGLVVIQVDNSSPLKDVLQLGDIILRINDKPVRPSSLERISPKACDLYSATG